MLKLPSVLRESYIWGLAIFLLLLVVVLIAHKLNPDVVQVQTQIDILAITGIPLFFVTILELVKTRKFQAAALVRSHISDFLSKEELSVAYHYLIYGYSDDTWKKVKSDLPPDIIRDDVASRTDENRNKVWSKLESFTH